MIMRIIKNVFVNGISLVTKWKAPAVEQAENKFALFKTKKDFSSDFLEIRKNFLKADIIKIKMSLNGTKTPLQ